MLARCSTEVPTPAADGADPLQGTPYRAVGTVGHGAMGEVLEAEHRGLRKRVVVKLLHEALQGDPRFEDRLRIEAQVLAAVSSPHVVAVTDLGATPAGRPYLVMERLHGRTLRQELSRRGALSVMEALDVTRQVLAGLSAAHEAGIVHRDIKLDNVFVCISDDGRAPVVKVLDFGVAKVLRGARAAAVVAPPIAATEQGVLVGTPRTVSPEQVRSQPIDARADIYAVGHVLYALLAGHGPFRHAEDIVDVLNAHLREVPAPPSRYARQPIPPDLDRAVLKALAKRPEHRFQTARELAAELARIEAGLGTEGARRRSFALDGAPALDVEAKAWFAPVSARSPAAAMNATPARADERIFALITVATAVLVSLIAVIVSRWLGAG